MAEFDYGGLWEETLRQMRIEQGEEEFNAWFTDITYLKSQENSLVIGTPSNFHRDQIKKKYQNNIKAKLQKLTGREITLEFELVPVSDAENAALVKKSNVAAKTNDTTTASTMPHAEKPKKERHPQMMSDYTFDKYVIGKNNDFAANAASAISKNPGTSYNPFLIYGGVGLGKTHLMQAIGNHIYENSDNKVIYVTSEDFLNQYMEGLAQNKMNSFKNKFRYVDVLLIDDIQFFQDKPGVQEELFHTFNALLLAKKQLVFTCDRPPSELKKFSERLISRFGQGLLADLQPPGYEERYAILSTIAKDRGTSIPNEVIDLISKNVSSNIRDLKGAFNTLISYAELMKRPITLEIAQQKLKDVFTSRKQSNLSIEIIQKAVAEFYSLGINDLKGKKRTQKVVYPRQLSMYICREMTDFSTTEIGEAYGGRDHTTVMHSIKKIEEELLTDPKLDSTIENLKRQIKELISK